MDEASVKETVNPILRQENKIPPEIPTLHRTYSTNLQNCTTGSDQPICDLFYCKAGTLATPATVWPLNTLSYRLGKKKQLLNKMWIKFVGDLSLYTKMLRNTIYFLIEVIKALAAIYSWFLINIYNRMERWVLRWRHLSAKRC